MKWRQVRGKINTKGRWEICTICEGYGKELLYAGWDKCIWCEGKGKVWRETSDKTYKPSEASSQ